MGLAKETPNETHVHAVFQSIAKQYDFMNSALSFGTHLYWRRFALAKMNLETNDHVLDVCCGTCDWAIALARKIGQNGRVTGLDFSANMLAVGKEKIAKTGLADRIDLVEGNAMALPFEANSFNHATIGFGIRNVPDILQVLLEMKRVIKPGGQVVSLELSKPEWKPFRAVYFLYFYHLLPLLGKILAGKYEQYRWLPESLTLFPERKGLEDLFRKAGLTNVRSYALTGGIAAVHIGVKPEDGII
jgi:demethylmenaquinone methyltransferase/2-methoxy-6-polyprenyl-1,4-benzoquinol methylase